MVFNQEMWCPNKMIENVLELKAWKLVQDVVDFYVLGTKYWYECPLILNEIG